MKRYINIIYDELKRFIKNNYKGIIFLVLFSCFCFYDTNYMIYRPGGTIDASKRISGNNLYESKGTFNMAYVGVIQGKLPFYLLAKIIPTWELIENNKFTISDNEEINDVFARDKLEYKKALNDAIYVAFNEANIPYTIKSNKYYLTYKTPQNDSDLKIGDEIIKYDDNAFTNVLDFTTYINTKNKGDKIKITYIHNNKTLDTYSTIYEENNKLYVGIAADNIIEIESDYNLKVKTKDSESGSSGGLINALAVYNALTDEDITKGKKIVGTGTISKDGKVGEIGGIKYKLGAAVKKHADIFLCPKENLKEALDYAKKYNYDIIIKDIGSFKEAIEYLKGV